MFRILQDHHHPQPVEVFFLGGLNNEIKQDKI